MNESEQSEVAEGNGTAATPNPDSEGGLDAIIDDILDDLEFMGTTSCQKKAKLKALIHRREQEKYDEGLADGLGGKLYKQINITEEMNIPQELRRNIEAEYAVKVLEEASRAIEASSTMHPHYAHLNRETAIDDARKVVLGILKNRVEQHRTKQ